MVEFLDGESPHPELRTPLGVTEPSTGRSVADICTRTSGDDQTQRRTTVETSGRTEAKSTGQYAEVNGIDLYYETRGAGRPLILLHGGLMSGETFEPILPALSERRQVIT